MNNKLIVLSVFLVFAVSLLAVALSVQPTKAAPCKPCETWGAIKACYSSNPPACCACGKAPEKPNQAL